MVRQRALVPSLKGSNPFSPAMFYSKILCFILNSSFLVNPITVLGYKPKHAIRISMSDYRKEKRLTNLPLYAVNMILNILD